MILGLAAGVALAGGAVHGAFHRNSPIFGRPITRLRSRDGRPVVALTFDDGPNPDATPVILDALRDRNVKATFFILGRHAEQWPDLVARVARDGLATVEFPHLLPFYRNLEYDTVYHEHLCYFSVKVIRNLFERFGLELVDVTEVNLHGGSVLVSAQPFGGPRRPTAPRA